MLAQAGFGLYRVGSGWVWVILCRLRFSLGYTVLAQVGFGLGYTRLAQVGLSEKKSCNLGFLRTVEFSLFVLFFGLNIIFLN